MAVSSSNNPNVVLNSTGRGSGQRGGAGGSVLHFPAAPDKLGMGMLFRFSAFSYQFGPGGKNKIVDAKDLTKAHIALPLPENLVDSLGINYETTDLGTAAVGFQTGAKTATALKDFLSSQESSAEGKDTTGATSGAAGTAEYVVRSLAQVSGSVSGMLNLASGNVPNPFQTAIFKNVEIRQHNFTFRLVPETPEDSVMIAKIITEFKYRALPTSSGYFLTMPDEVDVAFFGTNALYGFARCVIKRVQVNYAPQNVPAFFKDSPDNKLVGAPQAVELQVELSEIEQLTRDSYASEYVDRDATAMAAAEPRVDQPGNKLNQNPSNPPKTFGSGP